MSRRSPQLAFEAVSIEGGLVTPDFLNLVAELKADHQKPEHYELPKGIQVREEIGRSWQIALAHWKDLEKATTRGSGHERAVLALLAQAFGWNSLEVGAGPTVIEERTYPLTALAAGGQVPVVVAPAGQDLDSASPHFGDGTKRRSAFGLAQEFLNASDGALWGVVTNGAELRLVRDNASLTRPAWIEADLARIMTEQRYADFSLLWLLLHQTRLAARSGRAHDAILEQWRTESLKVGTAARDRLREGVEAALRALGNGFLKHPANAALRQRLSTGELDAAGYQQQLLRLVYRMIFLLVTEERELLHPPGSDAAAVDTYGEGYSLRRLRERAAKRRAHDRHDDAWEGLLVAFRGCAAGERQLGLPALGGLFALDQCPDLDGARLGNAALMQAVFRLTWLDQGKSLVRVNWRDMGTEELGSVYESLLELVPRVDLESRAFGFLGDLDAEGVTAGHSRRLTGSYYTPDSLVQAILDTALEPIIERALAGNHPEQALLGLAVLDPACGSAHFLLGAARRIAAHLARVRSDGTPDPAAYRAALREVVAHCLYGVDKNAMAVELARIALWLEAMEPGKPLAFLDHHLVHGDAILGILDTAVLADGIPDEAFKPLTGDDKETAKALKKENSAQRKALEKARKAGQYTMRFDTKSWAEQLAQVDAMPDTTLEEVAAKEATLQTVWASHADDVRLACDCYVAAFLLRKEPGTRKAIPTTGTLRNVSDGIPPSESLQAAVRGLAATTPFFHWSITFAPVMTRGGFDCVVGNPPWEKLKLQEKEFFETRDPDIAAAPNKAKRQELINELAAAPAGSAERRLFDRFETAKQEAEGASNFAHDSARYPMTGVGDVNLYPLFAETTFEVLDERGFAGLLLPSGIFSDSSTSVFFRRVVDGHLRFLAGFENEELLLAGVHHSTKFCMFVLSKGQSAQPPVYLSFLRQPADLSDQRRQFMMTPEQLRCLSPNTGSAPTFRSAIDAELTLRVYSKVPVLWDETKADGNPWKVRFQAMFHMAGDSHLFHDAPGPERLPLYEAKMIGQFDHRRGSFEGRGSERGFRVLPETPLAAYQDPSYRVTPSYWVDSFDVERRLEHWIQAWLLVWKDITTSTSERTVVATVIPRVGSGDTLLLLMPDSASPSLCAALLADLNSLVHDYLARQKVTGLHLKYHTKKQIATLPPDAYGESDLAFIVPRVLELTYTSSDLSGWAADLGHSGGPFAWEEGRRRVVRAELDAWFAMRYGLSRQDLSYVLDPEAALGEPVPTETFRVLREREVASFGEFLTQRLVLEAWDRLIGMP